MVLNKIFKGAACTAMIAIAGTFQQPAHAESAFGEIYSRKLATTLEFDRSEAEMYLCDELGLKAPPPAPRSEEEIEKEISGKAAKLADEKFPESLKENLREEAREKFQPIRKGDRVTVPVKSGPRYVDYTDIYIGIFGGKILVGKMEVRMEDLPEDFLERLDENKINEKRSLYLKSKFTVPKTKYRDELKLKFREEIRDADDAYAKFQETLSEREKKYNDERKLAAFRLAVPSFLRKGLSDMEDEKDPEARAEACRKLDSEISSFIRGLEIELGDNPQEKISEILASIPEYASFKDSLKKGEPAK